MADQPVPGTSTQDGKEEGEEEIDFQDQEQTLNLVLNIVVEAWLVEQMYVPNNVPLSIKRHRLFVRTMNTLAERQHFSVLRLLRTVVPADETRWPYYNPLDPISVDPDGRKWLYLMAVAYGIIEFLLTSSNIELSRFQNLNNAARVFQMRMAENARSNFGNLFLTEEALGHYRRELSLYCQEMEYSLSQERIRWLEQFNDNDWEQNYNLGRYFEWLFRIFSRNQTLTKKTELKNRIDIMLGRRNLEVPVVPTIPSIPQPPGDESDYSFAPAAVEATAELETFLETLSHLGNEGGRLTRLSRSNPKTVLKNAISYGFRLINGSVLDEGDQPRAASGRNSPPPPPSSERLRKKRKTTEPINEQEEESRYGQPEAPLQQQQQQQQVQSERLRVAEQQEHEETVRRLESEMRETESRASAMISEAEARTNHTATQLQMELAEVTEQFRQEKETLVNELETVRREYETNQARMEKIMRQRDAEHRTRTETLSADYDSSLTELTNQTDTLKNRARAAETRVQQLQEQLAAAETTLETEREQFNGRLREADATAQETVAQERQRLEAQMAAAIQQTKEENRAILEAMTRTELATREQELRTVLETRERELTDQARSEMEAREQEHTTNLFNRERELREEAEARWASREQQLREEAEARLANRERELREEAEARLANRERELREETEASSTNREQELRQEAEATLANRERELREEAATSLANRERELRAESATRLADRERELREEANTREQELREENRRHLERNEENAAERMRGELEESRTRYETLLEQHRDLSDQNQRLTDENQRLTNENQRLLEEENVRPVIEIHDDDDSLPIPDDEDLRPEDLEDPREMARRDENRIFNLQEPLNAAGQRLPNELYMRLSEDLGMLACVACRICLEPYNNNTPGRRIVFGYRCSHILCEDCLARVPNGVCPTCRQRERRDPVIDIFLGEMGRRYAAWTQDATILHSMPPVVANNREASEVVRRQFWEEMNHAQELRADYERAQAQIAQLEARITELENGAAGPAGEEERLNEQIRLLQEESESYRTRYLERVEAFNQLQEDLVNQQTTARQREDQDAEFRNDMLDRLEEMENLQQELEDVRSERDRNGQQLAAVRLQLEQATANHQTLQNAKDAELNRIREEKERELTVLRSENDAELRRLQEERESERNRIRTERDQELAERETEMANENETLTLRIQELTSELETFRQSHDSEVTTLRLDNENLRTLYRDTQERCEELQVRNQELERDLSEHQQYLADTEVDSDEEEEGEENMSQHDRENDGGSFDRGTGGGTNGGSSSSNSGNLGGSQGGENGSGSNNPNLNSGGGSNGGGGGGNTCSIGGCGEVCMSEVYSLVVNANRLLMGLQEEREDPAKFKLRVNRKRFPASERETRSAVLEPFLQRDYDSQYDVQVLTDFHARSVAPPDYKRSYDLLSIIYLNKMYKFDPAESAYSCIGHKLVFLTQGSPIYLFFNFQISDQPIEFSRTSSTRKKTERMFKAFLYAWTTVTSKNIHFTDLNSALKLMKSQALKFVVNYEEFLSYMNRCKPAIRFALCGGLVSRPIFYRASDPYDPPVALLDFAHERDWFWQRVLGPLRQNTGDERFNPRIVIGFMPRGDPIYDVPLFVFQGERDSLMSTKITLMQKRTVYCFDRLYFNSVEANVFGWPCGPSPESSSPVDYRAAGLIDAMSTTWVELREHKSRNSVLRFVVKLSDIAQTYQERQDLQLEKSARNYPRRQDQPGPSTEPDY